MKDLEERAIEKYKPIKDDYKVDISRNALTEDIRNGYIKGATEQRKIDIDKACEWLSCYGDDARWENAQDKIKEFRKAMEQ